MRSRKSRRPTNNRRPNPGSQSARSATAVGIPLQKRDGRTKNGPRGGISFGGEGGIAPGSLQLNLAGDPDVPRDALGTAARGVPECMRSGRTGGSVHTPTSPNENGPQGAVSFGGEGGIRTHVPGFPDHLISSQRRYGHFGTSPEGADSSTGEGPGKRFLRSLMTHCTVSAFLLGLAASGPLPAPASFDLGPPVMPVSLPDPMEELVVVTRPTPTTFFQTSDGRMGGLEYDLVARFAAVLGTRIRFIEASSYADALARLRRGEAHMAAADIVATEALREEFQFGPPYRRARQVLVKTGPAPRVANVAALESRRVAFAPESSADHHLRTGRPDLQLEAVAADHPEDALRALWEGRADYAITGAHLLDLARGAYPDLAQTLSVGPAEPVAWAFQQYGDPRLVKQARRFFNRIAEDGTLLQLMDRYYGHAKRLDTASAVEFRDAVSRRLPALRASFEQAGRETGIDWRFLAALAFQESKWDPAATSPTGVRGLMMLTEDTAARMGVKDRTDPWQSLLAGARYFRKLRDALPERIREPDRSWLALAAYNQGLGHLEDARVLAQRLGLDADTWIHVRQALPLLAVEMHYTTLKHGYARGGEAMALTENVRAYYQALVALEPEVAKRDLQATRESEPDAAGAMYENVEPFIL